MPSVSGPYAPAFPVRRSLFAVRRAWRQGSSAGSGTQALARGEFTLITSDSNVAERSAHGRLSMQRFRLLGLYLVGVVAVIGLAVWCVSVRRTAGGAPASGAGASRGSPRTATTGAAAKVSIDNSVFDPKELVVSAGAT